jgi:ATP synthase protein I
VIQAAVRRVVGLQVLVTLLISLPLLAFEGAPTGASAFLGGAIGFITSWVYARKMATPAGRNPGTLLRAHLVAEVWKLSLTVILFVAVLTLFKWVATLPMLLTFIATLAMYWVALLIVH